MGDLAPESDAGATDLDDDRAPERQASLGDKEDARYETLGSELVREGEADHRVGALIIGQAHEDGRTTEGSTIQPDISPGDAGGILSCGLGYPHSRIWPHRQQDREGPTALRMGRLVTSRPGGARCGLGCISVIIGQ